MVNPRDEIVSEWIEYIPDPDSLFMRVPVGWLPNGQLHPGIFREDEGAVSVDWSRYSNAEETRGRARRPNDNGVVTVIAGEVRSIQGLSVEHEPIRSNRSHSGIHGLARAGVLPAEESKTMRRSMLFELVNGWEIDPFH
jgi:hypothetical protein